MRTAVYRMMVALLVMLPASVLLAAPPATVPPTVYPEFPEPPVKRDKVAPPPSDGTLTLPPDGTLLIAHYAEKVSADGFPAGVLSVSVKQAGAGGADISGKFIDGIGKREWRNYKGPWIVTVEAGETAGEADLVIIKEAKAGRENWIVNRIRTGQAPQPPPAPKPDDDPKPKPEPQPNTLADAAWVVVVLETAQKTPELAKLLDPSGEFRKSLVTRRIGYREYDKDSPDLKSKRYLDYATQAGGLPFVLVLDKAGKVLRATKANAADLDKIAKGQ